MKCICIKHVHISCCEPVIYCVPTVISRTFVSWPFLIIFSHPLSTVNTGYVIILQSLWMNF